MIRLPPDIDSRYSSGMFFDLGSFSDATALIDADGAACTYRSLADRVGELSGRLRQRSVALCLTRNTVDGVVGYVACMNSGVVPILMDYQTVTPALLKMVATYRPRYIWAPEAHSDLFPGYLREHHLEGFYLLQRTTGDDAPLHDDLGLLLTTSGSTGSPKLVRIAYRNLLANTRSIIEYLGVTGAERSISTLPFSYSFGLSVLNTVLYAGASMVLTEASLFQREFWDTLRRHEVTSLSGVPYTYEMLKRVRFLGMELPSLRTLTQAGGKLSDELCREFAQRCLAQGKRFFVMYGATEASPRMSYLPSEMALSKLGSIGIPVPGGSFEIVGDAGEVVEPGQVGQLVYRGPNVAMGYAESAADLCKGDEFGGVLMTGDLARCDDDGYYFIVGRTKRFIKLFGVRTNLDEVEGLVRAAFPGTDVACAGEDNRLLVYVDDAAVCDAVHDQLAKAMRVTPSAIIVRHVASIPRNASGKIQYAAL
ncbi:MAG: AMP-binding protein [Curvibacter sp.]|jgi:long-chain acyl-CoA synthetase|nr:AMP-binding protein [Curvibacter sp.]